jgi:hypothetical protein
MPDKPIVTVSIPNDQARFEQECAYWVNNGYVLVSSSCSTHSGSGSIDEMWLAVFALPSVAHWRGE